MTSSFCGSIHDCSLQEKEAIERPEYGERYSSEITAKTLKVKTSYDLRIKLSRIPGTQKTING
jgi:hypothetical protein